MDIDDVMFRRKVIKKVCIKRRDTRKGDRKERGGIGFY